MKRLHLQRISPQQRGMSLPEALVALFVFSVIFLSALALYQKATEAYQATDSATIQQQNARFAIDRLSETIRDAGANYNPRGKSDVPDEQIEGAWQSAIIVRGDFDNLRETGLQTATFPIVTTGNHEIVAYILTKPGSITTSGVNSVPVSVIADLTPSTGRDAVKSGTTVPIPGEETRTFYAAAVNLAQQTNPPYQLTRVTFAADGTPQGEVIAENVFRLAFTYANASGGNVITSANVGSANGTAGATRDLRATIRSIGIDLITMVDRLDPKYTDPTNWTNVPAPPSGSSFAAAPAGTMLVPKDSLTTAATVPATRFRKFRLTEEVLSVNLGLKGQRHAVVPGVTIQPPPQITVCVGHHLSYYVSWLPSPTSGVDYVVRARAVSGTTYDEEENVIGTVYELKHTDEVRPFAFSVKAVSSGVESIYTDEAQITTAHDTAQSKPNFPINVVGPLAGNTEMDVTWDPVVTSSGTLATSGQCISAGASPGASVPTAPWNTAAPDVKEYHVFRSGAWNGNASFTIADPGNRVDNITVDAMVNTTPDTANFTDKTAAPCGQYYYRLTTYDTEDLFTAGAGSLAMGTAAHFVPAAGLTPAEPLAPEPLSASFVSDTWTVQLRWTPVYRDSTNTVSHTALYRLERQREQPQGSGNWVSDGAISDQYDKTQMTTPETLPGTVSGQPVNYRYRVIAVYPCGSVSDTDRTNASDWYYVVCTPPVNHSISITTPAAGEVVQLPSEVGFTPALGALPASGSQWTSATVKITGPAPDITEVYNSTDSSLPFNGFTPFNAVSLGLEDGTYTLTAYGTANGCDSEPVSTTFELETVVCGLTITGTQTLQPTSGGPPSSRRRNMRFQVANDCGAAVIIRGITFTWSGGPNFGATRLNRILYNNVNNTVSLTASSGSLITLATPITINAGATSSVFEIQYSHQMGDGTGALPETTWSSIIMRTGTSPSFIDDEVLITPITPNN